MIDLDELIAALRERAASDSPAHTLMNEAADALEAATRVPVQGEPNNDRENLITERTYGHGSITLTHYRSSGRIGVVQRGENSVMDVADLLVFLQDSGLDEVFSHATVPDAATDDMSVPEFCEALGFVDGSTTPTRLRDIVEPIQWRDSEARDHVECARICEQCGETLARTLCGECHGGGQRDGGNGTVRECGNCGGAGWLHEGCAEVSYADLVAERDAAVAAIERGRNVLELLRNYAEDSIGTTHGMLSASFVKAHVEIALSELDVAPEPEGRWEYRGRLQSCGYVAEGYISAEYAMNGLRGELEDHPYLVMDDTAIVERARVREWLPVEGESKP